MGLPSVVWELDSFGNALSPSWIGAFGARRLCETRL